MRYESRFTGVWNSPCTYQVRLYPYYYSKFKTLRLDPMVETLSLRTLV